MTEVSDSPEGEPMVQPDALAPTEDPLNPPQVPEEDWTWAQATWDSVQAYADFAGRAIARRLYPNLPSGEQTKIGERIVNVTVPVAAGVVVLGAAWKLAGSRRSS